MKNARRTARAAPGACRATVTILAVAFLSVPGRGLTGQSADPAELVAGLVSPQLADGFPSISADGQFIFFSRQKSGSGWGDQNLMVSTWRNGGWTEPRTLPFSGGPFSDRAPRLSVEGRQLFFSTNRPWPGETDHERADFDIWVVDRTSDDAWSDPRPLSRAVNSTSPDIHPAVTADGTLYFASARPGGRGRSDIFRAARQGEGFGVAESVGAGVNSPHSEPDLYVAPDGRMMIVAITDRDDGFGGDDLYVSFLDDGHWTVPANLGPTVNTAEYEYGPSVSGDGEYLYFTSHRTGGGDIYRVRVRQLPAMRR